jgi:lipopolysaccharide assembly outer membrane protein LptD (OstA)
MKYRFLATILAVGLLAAAPNQAATHAGFTFGIWNVDTSQFDYNWQSGAFSSPAAITLTKTGSSIRADRAFGNNKTKQATLTGNVVLHDTSGAFGSLAGGPASRAPATLTCDNLTIDGASKTYVATGNVHFIQGTSDVRADRAVMNTLTHDVHLYGHVHLTG